MTVVRSNSEHSLLAARIRVSSAASIIHVRCLQVWLCLTLWIFAGADVAHTEPFIEPTFATYDLTFETDQLWGRSSARVFGQNNYRIAAVENSRRRASHELRFAQSPAPPTDDSSLPVLPAPANAGVPPPPAESSLPAEAVPPADVAPPANTPAEIAPDSEGKPTTEFEKEFDKIQAEDKKKEEKKKDEKPPVPDLAKGLLIATNDGDLTFKPGLRIQPRYMYDSGNGNNDFFIRRFRLKGSGSAYGVAKYAVELKIDNEGRYAVSPTARAENAWLEFPVIDELSYMRVGLYDLPFSRDALTSDSKLLFMDRTLIKEQLTAVGMADNTYGVLFHGRPYCGQFEYAFGIFDNDQYERFGIAGTRESDHLMPAGRVVWNLLDPMTPPDGYADYMQSYLGKGERLELGASVAHLGNAVDAATNLDLTAWGVDLFANSGHYSFQTEYDRIVEDIVGGANVYADGWYAQFGYLFDPCDPCTEFAIRHEELDPLVGDTLRWTRVGFNFYIREHNLKIQTDYCFRSGTALLGPLPGGLGLFDEDVFEVQVQLDF